MASENTPQEGPRLDEGQAARDLIARAKALGILPAADDDDGDVVTSVTTGPRSSRGSSLDQSDARAAAEALLPAPPPQPLKGGGAAAIAPPPQPNKWALPELDSDGWHPHAGTSAECSAALARFNVDLAGSSAAQRKAWFSGDSPWSAALSPHKWAFERMQVLEAVPTVTAVAQGLMKVAMSTFTFYRGSFEESVRLPLLGHRRTVWRVCVYLSPTWRMVRCVEGFVGKEEEAFPFALQQLRTYTVHPGDDNGDASYARAPEPGCFSVVGGARRLGFELQSPCRGSVRMDLSHVPFKLLRRVGPGYYNLRAPFPVLGGLLDVGNHMSFLRLSSGMFLAVDALDPLGPAVKLTRAQRQLANGDAPGGGDDGGGKDVGKGGGEGGGKDGGKHLKEEIDRLTEGGHLLAAVVATHPFHTLGFAPFFAAYGHLPHLQWFGTPRHLRRLASIPWAGSVSDPAVLARWEGQGVFMRLPAGCEFDDPQPPASNHFANVFVYHAESSTVHNDDCLCYYDEPGSKMGLLALGLPGVRHDCLAFHASMPHGGLRPDDPAAARDFEAWLRALLADWGPFENLATAHNGLLLGGAGRRVGELLEAAGPSLDALAGRAAKLAAQKAAREDIAAAAEQGPDVNLADVYGGAGRQQVPASSARPANFDAAVLEGLGEGGAWGAGASAEARKLRGAWSKDATDKNCECG